MFLPPYVFPLRSSLPARFPLPEIATLMKRIPLFAFITLFSVLAVSLRAAEPTPPEGFRAIFNGRDLAGWYGLNPHTGAKLTGEKREANLKQQREEFAQHWRVENGELVNVGTGPYATTDQEFGDIELRIEYKTVPKADSGIYLRGTPQVQIWDSNEVFDPKKPDRSPHLGSGGLFNNTPKTPGRDPLVLADKPFGEWNAFRIQQVGARTWVWLNDKLVVDGAAMENYWDRTQPLPAKGPIMLQTHGGEIRWRNIFVREIPADEASRLLKQPTAMQTGALPAKNQFHLYLLIGQSNMAGRGAVDPNAPPPHPRVLKFTKELTWSPATDPLHYDKPIAGVGLGSSFARAMADADPSVTIGLVPCAVGGTPLIRWQKDGDLYQQAVERVQAAMKNGTLKGILWHQGENDAGTEETAKTYAERLAGMVRDLRVELNAENVPLVAGQLGEFLAREGKDGRPNFWPLVNEQLATLPKLVPNTAVASSAGLKHKGDVVHFDTASLEEFGRRYAEAMRNLTAAK